MTRKKKQTPAEVVIEAFGIRPLAAELGCSKSTPCNWRNRDGGMIEVRWHAPILALAKKQGLHHITAEVLVYGK